MTNDPSQQQPYGQSPYSPPASGGQQPYGQQPAPYGQQPVGPGGEPPLWAPYYSAPPVAAVKRFFQKYATFSGRASRSEYWWTALALAIVGIVLSFGALLGGLAGSTTDAYGESQPGVGFYPFAIIGLVVWLGVIVPSLALTVRRLHDIDQPGWWLLINFVPYLGSLVLFVFSLMGPKPEGARFDRPIG